MTRRRWIADEFFANHAAMLGEHAAHLARTLRARVGQEFEVACGDRVRRATISSVADDRVEFALSEDLASDIVVPVTLVLAVFKFDRMEWAIEKCTELNVTKIVPVIARRTEKHLAIAAEKRVERWRRIVREASEQSRRISPPEIAAPRRVSEALKTLSMAPSAAANPKPGAAIPQADESSLRIVLAESERDLTLSDTLRLRQNMASLSLAIGPEGGWTIDELQSFSDHQWISVSLGETILRAETAAIAAVVIARAGL
jgi:16S rRNA (uracil1498-N3)-methyltransferase